MSTSVSISRFSVAAYLRVLKPKAPEVQFWGYEVGNLLAAVAGAGGVLAIWGEMQTAAHNGFASLPRAIFANHADFAVTLGIAAVIVWVVGARAVANKLVPGRTMPWIDFSAAFAGLALVAYALSFGVTFLTASAVLFVCGSAVLRQCVQRPLLLKLGGLLLAAGGICLAGAGVTGGVSWLGVLTALTGVSVFFAGLLTYQGGIFACSTYADNKHTGWVEPSGLVGRTVSRWLDQPVLWCVEALVLPALFWVPAETKARKPYLTSMWARLPFRMLCASASLATFTLEGVLFAGACLLWALGDAAIGSMDA